MRWIIAVVCSINIQSFCNRFGLLLKQDVWTPQHLGRTYSTRNAVQFVFIVRGHKPLFLILTELKGKGLESGKLNLFICTPFFHIYATQYLSLASCSQFNMCHVPTLG